MALFHTRGRYMRAVLSGLGVTRRSVGRRHRRDCVTALLGQSNGESGAEPCNGVPGQGARFNPLNTTYNLPPCTDYNSVHVRNYASWSQGIAATVATYKLVYYVKVRAAMLDPKASAVDVAEAIAASPWGTGQLAVTATRALEASPSARKATWRRSVG